jgi:hypothetical protein
MRARGGSAGIVAKTIEPILDQESLTACGKFCVQVIYGVRKALESQMLSLFEPKRSIQANRFIGNALTRAGENCKRSWRSEPGQRWITLISTVGGYE